MEKSTGSKPRQIVHTGDRFGPAVVVIPEVRRNRKRYACMLCDCGEYYETQISQLFKGTADFCRCSQRRSVKEARQRPEDQVRVQRQAVSDKTRTATAQANTRNKTTHGMSKSHPLYSTWVGVISRCYNPNQRAYKNYGARGITVCKRWHDVRNFIADIECEIGPKPNPRLTLDRTDNDGNYEPGNVRWATRTQQTANRRPDKGSLAEQRIAELEARVAELEALLATRLQSKGQRTGRDSGGAAGLPASPGTG